MAAFGYVRSATGNVEQIEEQRRQIEAFLKERGMSMEKCYADSGSGLGDPAQRPGYGDVLGLLSKGDILVITDYARLSRGPGALMDAIRDLRDRGVNIMVVLGDD